MSTSTQQLSPLRLFIFAALGIAALNMAVSHYWLIRGELQSLKLGDGGSEANNGGQAVLLLNYKLEREKLNRATTEAMQADERAKRMLKKAVCLILACTRLVMPVMVCHRQGQ
jgi:hypothetical protein